MIQDIEVILKTGGKAKESIDSRDDRAFLDASNSVLHFEFKDGRQIQVYVRENGLCVSAVCGGRLVIEPGANNTMQVSAVFP